MTAITKRACPRHGCICGCSPTLPPVTLSIKCSQCTISISKAHESVLRLQAATEGAVAQFLYRVGGACFVWFSGGCRGAPLPRVGGLRSVALWDISRGGGGARLHPAAPKMLQKKAPERPRHGSHRHAIPSHQAESLRQRRLGDGQGPQPPFS